MMEKSIHIRVILWLLYDTDVHNSVPQKGKNICPWITYFWPGCSPHVGFLKYDVRPGHSEPQGKFLSFHKKHWVDHCSVYLGINTIQI